MASHSSTLAWKIPWMEEPGRLQSMGSLSRKRLSEFTFAFHFHGLEKEMATHSSVLAWRIQGWGSLVGCRLWGHTELDTTEATQLQQQPLIKYLKCHTPYHTHLFFYFIDCMGYICNSCLNIFALKLYLYEADIAVILRQHSSSTQHNVLCVMKLLYSGCCDVNSFQPY